MELMSYNLRPVFNPATIFKASDRRRRELPAWCFTVAGCSVRDCGNPGTRIAHPGWTFCERHLKHAVTPSRYMSTDGFDPDTLDAMRILGFSEARDLSPSSITNRYEAIARLIHSSHGGDMDAVERARMMAQAKATLLALFGVAGSSRS